MNKFLYYLLHITWGITEFIAGGIGFLICKMCRCESFKYGKSIATKIGHGWGGLNLGMFFFIGDDCAACCAHEYGHSIQTLWLGPFKWFVVNIPSAIRYWYRRIREVHGKPCTTAYDDIWFEGQATKLGTVEILKDCVNETTL